MPTNRVADYFPAAKPQTVATAEGAKGTAEQSVVYADAIKSFLTQSGHDPDLLYTFPMNMLDAAILFSHMGYVLEPACVQNTLGEIPELLTEQDFRRVHLAAERGRYYKKYPNPARDLSKQPTTLAGEVADYFSRLTPEQQVEWLQQIDPVFLLLMTAAAVESRGQNVLFEASIRKFGLVPPNQQ
jgi:hypothetical protein